MGLTKFIPGVY